MALVYLLYGLAFIATGLILGLQARLPRELLPNRALAWLSAFAVIHGASEWTVMGLLVEHAGRPLVAGERLAVVIVQALSFGLLLEFGVELLVSVGGKPRWVHLAPPVLTLTVGVAAIYIAFDNGPTVPPTAEALVRYGLGLGGALLAAYGLLLVRGRSWKVMTPRSRQLCLAGSIAFAAYGLLAGVVVPAAPFFPASRLNAEAMRALTGLPIEALRGLCAVALAWILSEIFVVESTRSTAELARLREEFISVVAHDLRSPVSTILMTAEQTERKLGDDERGAVLRKPLEKIRASSRRLDRMISDLLDASRIEARQLSLSPRLTDMRALIVAATDRSAAVCAGHPVRMQLPDQMPPVEVDPDRVEQVLTNLLSNAGKYSREGTAIVVTATARPPFLEVAVSNLDGRIDPADAKQIFTRFYRAEGAAQRAPGLGMGLYIAKGLVQAHGGDIWVEPDGDRTTFRFTLPLPRSRRPLVSLPRSRTADS